MPLEASCGSLRSYWILQHIWQPRVKGKGGIHPNLKVIAVPVLATILHTAPKFNPVSDQNIFN